MSPLKHLFNKDTQVILSYSAPHVLIKCFYDNVAAPVHLILEKWPELSALRNYFRNMSDKQCSVGIDQLESVRGLFRDLQKEFPKQSKLQITVDEIVSSFIIRADAPDDFLVRYERNGNRLIRRLPGSVTETDDGWMLRGYELWHYPKLNETYLEKFRKQYITERDLLEYTRDFFLIFRRADIRIESDIEYVGTPSVQLSLHSIFYNHINIRPHWSVAPETIDESISVPSHVVSGHTLRPGLSPKEVRNVLHDVKADTELKKDSIASFLDHWYLPWKLWITGETDYFESLHRWIKPPFHWILQVESQMTHGIGKAYAYPIACISTERLSVPQLAEAQRKEYYHLPTGWVQQKDIKTLGLNEDGTDIKNTSALPFPLNTEQLLCRGNSDIGDLWQGMAVNGVEWFPDGDKHQIAEKHIQYLIYWGLYGGLIGGYETFVAYGMPVLNKHAKKEPDCRMLILGNPEDIARFRHDHFSFSDRDKRISVETYEQYISGPSRHKAWDIAVAIEPEKNANKLAGKKGYRSRNGIQASCILCFPYENGKQPESADWMTDLFGYRENDQIKRCLIRDCRKSRALPDRFVFPNQLPEEDIFGIQISDTDHKESDINKQEAHISRDGENDNSGAQQTGVNNGMEKAAHQDPFAEITVDGPESKGTPIPPRKDNAIPVNKGVDKEEDASSSIHRLAADLDQLAKQKQESELIRDNLPDMRRKQKAEENKKQRPEAGIAATEEKRTGFINRDRLAQLRQETDMLRNTLLSANENGEVPAESTESTKAAAAPAEKNRPLGRHDIHRENPHSIINLEKVVNLRRESDEVREAVLATKRDTESTDDEERPDKRLIEKYDQKDERSKENLDKKEGNQAIIDERYIHVPSPLPLTAREEMKVPYKKEGLDEEWISFFENVDLDSLAAVMHGKAALEKHAKRRGVMPEVMLDDINTVASDTIGDLLLDEENDIYEEYKEIIQSHLKKE